MQNLSVLASSCTRELSLLGVQLGCVSSWYIDIRSKKRWGICKKNPDGTFSIGISDRLLQDTVPSHAVKSTIIHELLHTAAWGSGHKGEWKKLAALVNSKYPQYNIKRTSSQIEKGFPSTTPSFKYIVACTLCGTQYHRQRLCNVVKHPDQYRCSKCNGNLILLDQSEQKG